MLICFPCVNFHSSKLSLEKKVLFLHQFHVENKTKTQIINYSRNTTDFFLNGKILVLESNWQLALILISVKFYVKCYKMICLFTCSGIVFLCKLS